eukprot:363047-Chlamydomonas_euryale.AAC.1
MGGGVLVAASAACARLRTLFFLPLPPPHTPCPPFPCLRTQCMLCVTRVWLTSSACELHAPPSSFLLPAHLPACALRAQRAHARPTSPSCAKTNRMSPIQAACWHACATERRSLAAPHARPKCSARRPRLRQTTGTATEPGSSSQRVHACPAPHVCALALGTAFTLEEHAHASAHARTPVVPQLVQWPRPRCTAACPMAAPCLYSSSPACAAARLVAALHLDYKLYRMCKDDVSNLCDVEDSAEDGSNPEMECLHEKRRDVSWECQQSGTMAWNVDIEPYVSCIAIEVEKMAPRTPLI